jgi:ribonuclease BN (tRNA processing enzyme)
MTPAREPAGPFPARANGAVTETRPLTRVTILGSGTCVPSLNRSACSVLVESDGRRLLLDVGPGTMRRLLEAGVTIDTLDALLLSHFHLDHSGELAPLLFSSKYGEFIRRRPLVAVGGPGFTGFFSGLKQVYGRWIELPPEQFELRELPGDGMEIHQLAGMHLACAPVNHSPESLAYRLTDGDGCSVVYSGDTDMAAALTELARGAELLICEAAFPASHRMPGHLTPALAGEIAARAGVGTLVLTHFYPACETADITAECRQSWHGPLVLARDLLQIPLSRPAARPCVTTR